MVFSSLIVLQTFGTSSFYVFTSDETDEKVNDAYLYAYACMLVGMLVCAFRVDETSGFYSPRTQEFDRDVFLRFDFSEQREVYHRRRDG